MAAKTAHAIKGSAANVGASRLADTAARLEIACKADDPNTASTLMRDTRANFEAARGWLKEHLKQSA
jgi:HPt (histidine-containing phosphotransfer) domain-containing protein